MSGSKTAGYRKEQMQFLKLSLPSLQMGLTASIPLVWCTQEFCWDLGRLKALGKASEVSVPKASTISP